MLYLHYQPTCTFNTGKDCVISMEFHKLVRSHHCIRSFAGTPVDVSLLRDIVDAPRGEEGNGKR